MGRALGILEVALGGLLALDVWRPAPVLLAAAMLIAFTGLLIRAVRRRVRVPCGCLGSGSRTGTAAIARNVLLLTFLATGVVQDARGWTFWNALDVSYLASLALISVAGGLIGAVVIAHVGKAKSVSLRVISTAVRPDSAATWRQWPVPGVAGGSHARQRVAPAQKEKVERNLAQRAVRHTNESRDRPTVPPPRPRPPKPERCEDPPARKGRERRPPAGDTEGRDSSRPFLTVEMRGGSPAAFRLRDDVRVSPKRFFVEHASEMGLGPHDEMTLLSEKIDTGASYGYAHFAQTHKGRVVIGAEYTLTSLAGFTVAGLGRIVRDLDAPAEARVPDENAAAVARAAIARRYRRLDPSRLHVISRLVFIETGITGVRQSRLAYRCLVDVESRGSSYVVDVDANTAAVLHLRSDIVEAWAPDLVEGNSLYDGPVTARGEYDDSLNQSRLRTNLVVTLNGQDSGEAGVAIDYVTDGHGYTDPEDRRFLTAHWAAEQTMLYLATAFSLDGVDGKGGGVTIFVDARDAETNESLNSPKTNPASREIRLPTKPYINPHIVNTVPSLDIIAHEIGHCVTTAFVGMWLKPGFETQGESGALGETFADIIAVLTEFHATPATAEWTMFEDWASITRQRFFDDPSKGGDPSFYLSDPLWLPDGWPDQSELIHTNCGVSNRWFYLFCEGVLGIGRPLAARIVAKMLLEHKLQSNSQFADARAAAGLAAAELCGEFSQPHYSALATWQNVGVGGDPSLPWTVPEDDEADTMPWPVRLEWQVGIGETAWQVELSTDAAFSTSMVLTSNTIESAPPPMQVGTGEILLQADTEYFWRVTATQSPALEKTARPIQRFVTDKCQPQLIAPRDCGDDRVVHPWCCQFSWEPVGGAQSYLVELSRNDFDADGPLPDLLFGTETTGLTSIIRDLPKNTPLWWRVKATHDVSHEGVWSKPQPFMTDTPRVQLAVPASGSSPYPWQIQLGWHPVVGALAYRVELTTNPFPPDVAVPQGFAAFDFPIEIPDDVRCVGRDQTLRGITGQLVNLPAVWVGQLSYDWQVRVYGPPPWNEEGDPSEIWQLSPDGHATIPTLLTFADLDPPGCVVIGEPMTFEWSTVDYAVGYNVTIRELIAPLGEPKQAGIQVFSDFVTASSGLAQSLTLDFASSPTSGAKDVNGYCWEVAAVGPEGLGGLTFQRGCYYLRPTTPDPLPLKDIYRDDEEVEIGWTTQMAHGGGFNLEIYYGDDCSGAPKASIEISGVASPGETIVAMDNVSIGQYSWRVRPFCYQGCAPCSFQHWSPCRKLLVKKKYVAPQPTSECGETVKWGTVLNEVHHIDLHKSEGTFTFHYNALDIPDKFIVTYENEPYPLFNECVGDYVGWPAADVVLTLPPGGTSTVITVAVWPNCDASYQGKTEWEFKVSCPE
jgi:hypothetical protein